MKIFGIITLEKMDLDWIVEKFLKIFRKKPPTKETAVILFVDDEEFPVVENLRKNGWNVQKVDDLDNLENEFVKRSHIIFVDYKGVGKVLSENEEGIGVIKALKRTYGSKKRVILYSGHTFPLGPHFRIIDNQLPKNSDTYEFESMIRSELEKIK